jgi:hypothetical protein
MLHGLGDSGDGWAPVGAEWAPDLKHVKFIFPHAPNVSAKTQHSTLLLLPPHISTYTAGSTMHIPPVHQHSTHGLLLLPSHTSTRSRVNNHDVQCTSTAPTASAHAAGPRMHSAPAQHPCCLSPCATHVQHQVQRAVHVSHYLPTDRHCAVHCATESSCSCADELIIRDKLHVCASHPSPPTAASHHCELRHEHARLVRHLQP